MGAVAIYLFGYVVTCFCMWLLASYTTINEEMEKKHMEPLSWGWIFFFSALWPVLWVTYIGGRIFKFFFGSLTAPIKKKGTLKW
jgi:hypothetical protein